jgi:hypothetical protein
MTRVFCQTYYTCAVPGPSQASVWCAVWQSNLQPGLCWSAEPKQVLNCCEYAAISVDLQLSLFLKFC